MKEYQVQLDNIREDILLLNIVMSNKIKIKKLQEEKKLKEATLK